jgi:four helix bundle protein
MQNFNDKLKTDLKLRAYSFGLRVIKLCDSLPNKRAAWVVADQLIRCSCSIGANLVEAKAASSRLEFKKFNEISLKSTNESQFWLCMLRDAGLTGSTVVEPLLRESVELANMLAAGVKKLKSK